MFTISKTTLLGNLGSDVQIEYLTNGTAKATFSLATHKSWIDQSTQERREHTEWHRIKVFGKKAEIAGEYLKKGSRVYLEGENVTSSWKGNDDIQRSSTEVVVQQGIDCKLLILDKKDTPIPLDE